jgi:hypothetical protein
MTKTTTKLTFHGASRRIDAHAGLSNGRNADIALDTHASDPSVPVLPGSFAAMPEKLAL